jgi:ACDE family multidrug resistance protein
VIAFVLLLVPREAIGAADADAPPARPAAILVAVDATPASAAVTRAAAAPARERGANVEVVHVLETDVVGEDAADLETTAGARAVLDAHVGHLTRRGIAARGALLHAVGTRSPAASPATTAVEVIVVEPEELAA